MLGINNFMKRFLIPISIPTGCRHCRRHISCIKFDKIWRFLVAKEKQNCKIERRSFPEYDIELTVFRFPEINIQVELRTEKRKDTNHCISEISLKDFVTGQHCRLLAA